MPFYDDHFDEEVLKSVDLTNPDLQSVADIALRETLSAALDGASTINELWGIFREVLTQYQYSLFVASLNDTTRREIYAKVYDNEYSQLRRLAIKKIIEDEGESLREQAINQIKAELQDEDEIIAMQEELESRLIDEMRPDIEEQLRTELKSDPQFLEKVKLELKKAILGL